MERVTTKDDIGLRGEEKIPLRRRFSSGDLPEVVISETPEDDLTHEERFYLGCAPVSVHSALSEKGSTSVDSRRRIRITEVVPSNSSIIGGSPNDWRPSLGLFSSKKLGADLDKVSSKRIRSFYKAQDELITAYEEMQLEIDDAMYDAEEMQNLRRKTSLFAKLSLLANVLLFVAKIVASAMSGSISIISSLVDSAVDLASGTVMWIAARAVKKRDPYMYPQGRTKLEPIAIIILSVIMSFASLQLIRESIEKIIDLNAKTASPPIMEIPTIVITVSAVAIKLTLFLLCRRINSPGIQALAQDHRNDVLSNSCAVVFGYIGSKELLSQTGVFELVYVDPVGAILICIYIIVNWSITGYAQVKCLTGHTAKPDFLKKLTWLCVNHHKKLRYVDTVRAFHFGNNFLVEVDIVLPEDMRLREAHDIGESLQHKLERLSEVERAFVHLDYEYDHNPWSEHKTV